MPIDSRKEEEVDVVDALPPQKASSSRTPTTPKSSSNGYDFDSTFQNLNERMNTISMDFQQFQTNFMSRFDGISQRFDSQDENIRLILT